MNDRFLLLILIHFRQSTGPIHSYKRNSRVCCSYCRWNPCESSFFFFVYFSARENEQSRKMEKKEIIFALIVSPTFNSLPVFFLLTLFDSSSNIIIGRAVFILPSISCLVIFTHFIPFSFSSFFPFPFFIISDNAKRIWRDKTIESAWKERKKQKLIENYSNVIYV